VNALHSTPWGENERLVISEHGVPTLWVSSGNDLLTLSGIEVGERILDVHAGFVQRRTLVEVFLWHLDDSTLAAVDAALGLNLNHDGHDTPLKTKNK